MSLCLGCAGSSLLLHRPSLAAASGGAVFVAVRGFLNAVTSLVAEHGPWVHGSQELRLTGSAAVTRGHGAFISCGSQAPCLQLVGLAAPRHMESSGTRDWTHVPCTGRRTPTHCATREVPQWHFFSCVLNSIFHNGRKFSCFAFYKSLSCLGYYNKRRLSYLLLHSVCCIGGSIWRKSSFTQLNKRGRSIFYFFSNDYGYSFLILHQNATNNSIESLPTKWNQDHTNETFIPFSWLHSNPWVCLALWMDILFMSISITTHIFSFGKYWFTELCGSSKHWHTSNDTKESIEVAIYPIKYWEAVGRLVVNSGFTVRWGGKESVCQCRRHKRCGFNSWVRKILWRRKWLPILVFLSGKFHGQRRTTAHGVTKNWTWQSDCAQFSPESSVSIIAKKKSVAFLGIKGSLC